MKFPYYLLYTSISLLIFASCNNTDTIKNSITLKNVAEEVTKRCPKPIDFMTTLVNCEYHFPNKLQYNYMVDIDLTKLDAANYKDVMEVNVKFAIVDMLNKAQNNSLKKLNPVLKHTYKTMDGKLVCETSITPDMYNKNTKTSKMTDDEMYKYLSKIAKIFNTKKYTYIDDETLLVNCKAVFPRTIEYCYMATSVEISELDVDVFSESIRDNLSGGALKNDDDLFLKYNDTVFRFTYYDRDSVFIASVDVFPKDYR